jgi:hypothetical protein
VGQVPRPIHRVDRDAEDVRCGPGSGRTLLIICDRPLLDTNVLIHREAAVVLLPDIGKLFYWLDRLGHDKCVHCVRGVRCMRGVT